MIVCEKVVPALSYGESKKKKMLNLHYNIH